MITSLTNKTVKDLAKLKNKKYRDQTSRFLVDGPHMCEEALKAGAAEMIITTDSDYQSSIPVLYVSEAVMAKLSFTQHPQNIMALCHKTTASVMNPARILMLDGVQDPGNVGTMIRTALAFGYDQVILSLDSADLYNDKVLRSTQGALFHIDIVRADLKEEIARLKAQKVKIIGTALDDQAKTIDEIACEKKMAFIMGSEGQGMHEDILACCDQRLYIPIKTMESLNVAIAAGIVMRYFYQG